MPEHKIGVEQHPGILLPIWRAECSCGWRSGGERNEAEARRRGDRHVQAWRRRVQRALIAVASVAWTAGIPAAIIGFFGGSGWLCFGGLAAWVLGLVALQGGDELAGGDGLRRLWND